MICPRKKKTFTNKNLKNVNLYHTKSSCLVNGKQKNVFIRDDLPEILKIGEQNLIKHGTTVDEVKATIQRLILSCSSGVPDVQDCSAIGRSEELKALNSVVENVRKSRHEQNLNGKSETSTDGKSETSTDLDHVKSLETTIDVLVKSISELRD